MSTIIHNADLLAYREELDLGSLADVIDPEGKSLVGLHLMHNDTSDIRAIMLLKVKYSNMPYEAQIDFPFGIYNQIAQEVDDEGNLIIKPAH